MHLRATSANVNLLLATVFTALAGMGAALFFWEPSLELAGYVGLLLLFTALVGGLILQRWAKGQLDWFEPGVFVSLLYLAVFGYGGLRLVAQPALLHPLLESDRRWLFLGLFFIILGVIAFWVGYYGPLGRSLSELVGRTKHERLRATAAIQPFWVVALYAIGLGARLYMIQAGWYSYLMQRESYFSSLASAQVFMMVELFCRFALVLAWLDHFSHPRDSRRRLLAYALMGSELFWGFFSGMKSSVLYPILLVAMAYTYKRGRFPLRVALVALLLVVLLYPINGTYRELVRSGTVQIRSPVDMIATTPLILRESLFQFAGSRVYLESGYESTVNRATSLLQNYALLIKYLDTTGAYWRGRELVLLPALVFVPRFIWPDKPLYDKGYWFAVNVWGQDPHIYSSIALTYPGDLYLQFGLLSLVLGMFLTGVLFRWLYERCAWARSDYYLFFYIFLFYSLVRHESDLVFKLAGTMKIFLILFVLSLLVFRPARRLVTSYSLAPPIHAPGTQVS